MSRRFLLLLLPGWTLLIFPNHPAADAAPPAAVLFSEAFDDAELLKRGWYDGDRLQISTNDPFAGSGCIEYRWRARTTTPESSSGLRRQFEPTESVAIRYYLRLSRGWGWSGRDYHPHLTHFMTTENGAYDGPAASHLTTYLEPVNGRLRLAAQDIQNKDAPSGLTQGPLKGGYNGKFYDSREILFDDEKWHCVEAYYQLNSIDPATGRPNSDGIARAWFDDQPVVDHSDVVFRSGDFPDMKFNQFLLLPYFGPGLLPHEQTLWIDELAVDKVRIGPLKPSAP